MVRSGTRTLSLADLHQRCLKVAAGFQAAGIREGNAIALLLRNDIPFIETLFAASSVGAYSVPINWRYSAQEVQHILVDSQANLLVIHADLLRAFKDTIPPSIQVLCVETPAEVRDAFGIPLNQSVPVPGYPEWEGWLQQYPHLPRQPHLPRGSMIYTSGTTGLPKGVKKNPVSPDNRRAYLDLRAQWFGHRHGMRTAIVGPMYHSVQSTYAIAAVQSNGVVYLMPKFDAEAVLELIHTARLTHLHLVPTMMIRLLQLPERVRRQYDVSSLEFVVHGAAPCPRETKRKMIDWWGKIIFEYYGTTEAGMVCRSSSEEWLEREGTVGKAWPGRTIRIYDEEGNPQPPNVPGEVYMSLGLVPDFTYHNAAGKREQIGRDGLITNGDIGYLDEDGYLFLCDRKYDTIISGGVNIYPFEIESVLLSHPAVFDCAVYGVPDANLGEVPAASVQLRIGVTASPEEFADFLNERLARFKVPRRIEMCEALPRDESGKIYKRLLKATASLSPNRSDYFPW